MDLDNLQLDPDGPITPIIAHTVFCFFLAIITTLTVGVVMIVAVLEIGRCIFGTSQDRSVEGRRRDREEMRRQLDKAAPEETFGSIKSAAQQDGEGQVRRYFDWLESLTECIICMDDLGDDDMVRHLCCGHVYHSHCITKWYLRGHHRCPMCKCSYAPACEPDRRRGSRQGTERHSDMPV